VTRGGSASSPDRLRRNLLEGRVVRPAGNPQRPGRYFSLEMVARMPRARGRPDSGSEKKPQEKTAARIARRVQSSCSAGRARGNKAQVREKFWGGGRTSYLLIPQTSGG